MKLYHWARIILLAAWTTLGGQVMAEQNEEAIASVLNQFHKAAAEHDYKKYFSLMNSDAVFIGTDPKERWDINAFRAYVKPFFDKGQGWTYVAKERHISLAANKAFAFFDEILDNAKYGECRGTGVLVKVGKEWKISQYHLTFPVPNELAEKVTGLIRAPR